MNYSVVIPYLLEGTVTALKLFALTLLLAVPLGLLVARLRAIKNPLVNLPVKFYLLLMRGTPLLLQLIFFMYFPPFVLGISIDRFIAALIAFSLNYGAYFAEIFRGGIDSIPQGQSEAAKVLGFSSWQTFSKITLPQVIKRVIPASANECMTLVKDTALAQTIGVFELFRAAQNTTSREVSIIPIFIAGAFYLVMNSVVAAIFNRAEKKLSYYKG
ncbi:MAG: amino acid ABC transporter permease [Clostridiaceae bacterium]|nr:amino acid ABC transporter permease [Clostridiaceae bacterium]